MERVRLARLADAGAVEDNDDDNDRGDNLDESVACDLALRKDDSQSDAQCSYRDEVLAENLAEVSGAASTFSPSQIAALAAREREGVPGDIGLKDADVGEDGEDTLDEAALQLAFRVLVSGGSQEQEFDVLGTTTLRALREATFCTRDHVACGPSLYDNYCFFAPPGSFFVSQKTTNVAAPICAALQRAGTQVAQHKIDGVSMWDLHASGHLALGPALLLLHQGDCEHRVEVLRVRQRPPSYPRRASAYPLLRFAAGVRRPMCTLCAKFWARYMCFEDGVSGEDPSKFCTACFKMIFYDESGALQPRFANMRVVPLRYAV